MAPMGWQAFYFYLCGCFIFSAVEGKGHLCGHPVARTQNSPKGDFWPPLPVSVQEREEPIDPLMLRSSRAW